MFGSRLSRQDDKGGACRRMWRTLRKEKTILVHTVNGLLLAHYEKGHSRICEKVSQLLGQIVQNAPGQR